MKYIKGLTNWHHHDETHNRHIYWLCMLTIVVGNHHVDLDVQYDPFTNQDSIFYSSQQVAGNNRAARQHVLYSMCRAKNQL